MSDWNLQLKPFYFVFLNKFVDRVLLLFLLNKDALVKILIAGGGCFPRNFIQSF